MAFMWVLFFVIPALQQTVLGKATGSCFSLGVIGGDKIQIEDAPYMAALFHDNLYMCGGSIIDDWFILTSAYCCMSSVNNVHVGSGNVYLDGTTIKVNHAVIHEDYNNKTFVNNICLLKLENRVLPQRNVAKVNLANEQFHIDDGTLVKITGWGLPTTYGHYPDALRQASIPVVSDECCHHVTPFMTHSSFCAGSPGHDFCDGDVGGPLTYNNVQVGIASTGTSSRCGLEPALYTKISSFYSWINEVIESNM